MADSIACPTCGRDAITDRCHPLPPSPEPFTAPANESAGIPEPGHPDRAADSLTDLAELRRLEKEATPRLAEVERLRRRSLCAVCAGTGKAFDGSCICGGSGQACDEAQGLREWGLGLDRTTHRLRDILKSLRNEASGFVAMADSNVHGVTNIQCLKRRIAEADDALAALEGGL